MKRITALTAAALMSGALFAAPALAQTGETDTGVSGSVNGTVNGSGLPDAGVDADVGANANAAANTSIDTNATASIDSSWDGLMSAMANSGESKSLSSMTDVGNVTVVKISSIDNADMDAFAKARAENQASIDELHSAIDANAKLKAALDAQGVDSSDVVATNVAADGTLTVYVE